MPYGCHGTSLLIVREFQIVHDPLDAKWTKTDTEWPHGGNLTWTGTEATQPGPARPGERSQQDPGRRKCRQLLDLIPVEDAILVGIAARRSGGCSRSGNSSLATLPSLFLSNADSRRRSSSTPAIRRRRCRPNRRGGGGSFRVRSCPTATPMRTRARSAGEDQPPFNDAHGWTP